jgi:threonyl-tRNA synthetase
MSEIQVRLPDGKTLQVPAGSTVLSVAERIGKGLARAALAGRIDGRLVDLRTPLRSDVGLFEVVTDRDPAAGCVIRHSAEHVMADAVKRFFPDCQIDVGRSDHSEKFQYDFLVERPFTPADLEQIEKEMGKIVAERSPFAREVVSREQARALFASLGEELKVSRLGDIPEGEEITLFRHGGFVDLCRGPHVQRADQIGAFQLLESAGSYWRGDERNPMLQRIYGTAFASRKELEEHAARLEEAKRRDHRRLGVELELFHVDPISPGSPFYLPRGMVLYNGLVDFIRSLYPKYGYQEVMTMQGDEGEELGVKPMNCPGHCHLYASRRHSYRELPVRFAEFSRLHRNERSGTLTGLARVRSFAQDDAHVFCLPEQIEAETHRFFDMVKEIYAALGLEGVSYAVSTRPEAGFLGDAADWERAEQVLRRAVESAGFACAIHPGDAAFYGPKIECEVRDVLGRPWTLGTLQIDVAMPTRFGLRYVGPDDQLHVPAMLHRAILGSLERFIALYTEQTGGDFPLWLAPLQVSVLPITDRNLAYARKVEALCAEAGLRADVDERNEKLGWKVRDAELRKVPALLVVGDREQADGTAALRRRHAAGQEVSPVGELVAALAREVKERRVTRPTREE